LAQPKAVDEGRAGMAYRMPDDERLAWSRHGQNARSPSERNVARSANKGRPRTVA
jgi:hypothetical protein